MNFKTHTVPAYLVLVVLTLVVFPACLSGRLEITSIVPEAGGVRLDINCGEGNTNDIEIYSCDLLGAGWKVLVTNISVAVPGPISCLVQTPTNHAMGFFVIGDAETDSDEDGVPDAREIVVYNSSPVTSDTDGDGVPDGWEINSGLDPLSKNGADDIDGDGLSNAEEYELGTNPLDASDGIALFEQSRKKIVTHWHMVMDSDLVLDDEPGSSDDLASLSAALNNLSGKFYRTIP